MASTTKGKLFFAEAEKGYVLKVLFDSLAAGLSRTSFVVRKDGIYVRDNNESNSILYDVFLPRERFKPYICRKEIIFSINLKHLQKMVKNIKKKDSVILFVERRNPSVLCISIKPSGSVADKYNAKRETVTITITIEEENEPVVLPEIYVDEEGYERDAYGFPMVISAPEFQKLKKASTIGNQVHICMQKNNYISFGADSGSLYGTSTEFGEIVDRPEMTDEEDEIEESGSSEDEESGSSEEEDEIDSEDDEEIIGWYEATFSMTLFSILLKLPGLGMKIQFYSPKVDKYPLRVSMQVGDLGDITIYVKDSAQVEYEKSIRDNEMKKISAPGEGKIQKKR